MGCFKIKNKIMLTVNAVIISAICILNYFYQRNGFDYLLKCICSGSFALLGIINLSYALIAKQSNIKFYVGMFAGFYCFARYLPLKFYSSNMFAWPMP